MIDWAEYKAVDDREFIACVTQAFIAEIWAKRFEEDEDMKAAEEAEREEEQQAEEHWKLDLAAQNEEADALNAGGATDTFGQSPESRDPLLKTNRQLAEHIKRSNPLYRWDANGERHNEDEIRFPGVPKGVRLQRRGYVHIAGRGQVNVSFAHPPQYAEPVLWWFNQVMWEKPPHGALPNEAGRTASYLEFAVDFELARV